MVDTRSLRAEMVRKGVTQEDLAKELNMTSRTFSSRMKKGVFGSDEIEKLVSILDIKDPMSIFFCQHSNLKRYRKSPCAAEV